MGLRAIARDFDLPCDEIAYVGDDLNDLLAFRISGYPIAVANAAPEVKAEAASITQASGGQGAIREIIEAILHGRGCWEEAVNNYLTALREPERFAKMPRTEE
jgi:3-deoxy-D-manno-octulosonate 8-phosphate phosphatase (KDO 8-P phosphatase)